MIAELLFQRLVLVLSVLVLTSVSIQAQLSIQGLVVDASGQPLPGVNVYLPSTYEGSNTDSLGRFAFSASAKTPFTLAVEMIGFRGDSLVLSDAAAAQQPLRFKLRETAAALSEIVVTAGSFTASDTRRTAVLSSIDVATTGATADLAEALSTLPGSTPAGESGQLLVRGGSAEETQAYINGLRVPKLYSASLPDLPSRTRFSPFTFRGITFATGGFSAAYGDALSGALLLQTQGLPQRNLTSVSIMTLGGSIGRTQKLGRSQAIAFDLGGTHLGGYVALNGVARQRIQRAPQGLTGQGAYWWDGRGGRNLRVSTQVSSQHFAALDSTQAPFYGASRLALDNVNSYSQAVYQVPAAEGLGRWELGAAVATDLEKTAADAAEVARRQYDAQLRASYASEWRQILRYQIGTEGQWRREQSELGLDGRRLSTSSDRAYVAGFAEGDYYASRSWVLRAGVRYDQYDGRHHLLSPRVQVSHLFSADHQLALSAGQYAQRQVGAGSFALDAANDLQPARADQLGLTYSRTWAGRVLRAEAYAKTYHDLLTRVAGTGQLGTAGRGYARGVDLFVRDRSSIKNADFWLSYSFTDAQRQRDTLTGLAPVSFASRHNVALVAKRFFTGPSFGISATYRWHAGRPFDDPNSAERFGDLTPDFHDLSVNVTYITKVAGHFTVIFASMSNVTGVRQVHQYRYAQQPSELGNRYERIEVRPIFPKFPFVGMFVSIGDRDRQGSVDDI